MASFSQRRRRIVAVAAFAVVFLCLAAVVLPADETTELLPPPPPTHRSRPVSVAPPPTDEEGEGLPSSPTEQPARGDDVTTTREAVEDPSTTSPRLPNGPPGLSRTFTSSTAASFFVPIHQRANHVALELIFDDVVLQSCDAHSVTLETVATMLGRTRVQATISRCEAVLGNTVEETRKHLEAVAPSWFVAGYSDSTGTMLLKRRSKLFVFCIGGGNDGRANFVERTWGQRTPIQWYTDTWTPQLRPIVDLHPLYKKDPFNLLAFKISRIWQRVYEDYGNHYDWYVRLWDDNYFHEENAYNVLGRFQLPHYQREHEPLMVAKMAWRNMGVNAVYPFAGGGAGWFLNRAGLHRIGPNVARGEQWFQEFRNRKDIFLKHHIHDEDVFLTAWFHNEGVAFQNAPGLEHVSPGMQQKQRCLSNDMIYKLRWDPNVTIYFDYPAHEAQFRQEDAWYAFTKPIVWHYMSPSRLVHVETLLYPHRKPEFARDAIPKTAADAAKPNRKCYPGVPSPEPQRGLSRYETPLPDPPLVQLGTV